MESMTAVDAKLSALQAKGLSAPDIIRQLAPMTLGWPYVFGAWGEQCTPGNRRKRQRDDHPTIVSKCQVLNGSRISCGGCKWNLPVRQYDCRGYTHWLLDCVGIRLIGGGCTSQWNTDSNWAEKGDIANMPRDKVCCVFKGTAKTKEHTGMYMGDGDTIYDCSSGVQKHSITNKAWNYYAIPKGLYSDSDGGQVPDPDPDPADQAPATDAKPTLRRGSKGEYVTALQTALVNRGYSVGSYGVDGSFGKDTEKAVKQFQQDWGLAVDGIVGPKTWAMLETTIEQKLVTVHIPGLTSVQADALVKQHSGAWTTTDGE